MRTWLFVPGHDARKMRKALESEAEVVVIDWEDGVPPDRKHEARSTTASLLAAFGGESPRRLVRVNSARDPYFADDMAAMVQVPVSAVMLPKVEDPQEVADLAHLLEKPVIPLLESALGIERAFDVAHAHPNVERLAFGSLDFLLDLGVQWEPDNPACRYAQARISVAGRAAGLQGSIDSVYPQLDDQEGLRRDALAARALGFTGKLLLHPAQIAPVREVFTPSPEELAQARAIVQAFEEARARGEAVVRLGGAFIDPPVVKRAQNVLAMDNAG